jgi:hypothetical protein
MAKKLNRFYKRRNPLYEKEYSKLSRFKKGRTFYYYQIGLMRNLQKPIKKHTNAKINA